MEKEGTRFRAPSFFLCHEVLEHYEISMETTIFEKDKTRDYSAVYHEIDISGCSTLEDVAKQIASSVSNSYVRATAAGTKVTFTTSQIGTSANSTTVAGISRASSTQSVGGSPDVSAYDGFHACSGTV